MVRTIRQTLFVLTACSLMGMANVAAEEGSTAALSQTPEEHAAAAQRYEQKAVAARQEVAEHEAMLDAAYRAEVHSKAPIRRKWEQMRKHCTPIIRDAKRLAQDLETFAAFHRVQSEELKAQERP
jgi:hypothetical protein